MNAKKNAPISAGTPIGAKEKGSRSAAAISVFQSTTPGRSGQVRIADYLGQGKAAGISLSDLIALTGMDSRTVRLRISRERLEGTPILSDNANGYFLPESEEEKQACVRSLKHRAREIMRVARAIKRSGGGNCGK